MFMYDMVYQVCILSISFSIVKLESCLISIHESPLAK